MSRNRSRAGWSYPQDEADSAGRRRPSPVTAACRGHTALNGWRTKKKTATLRRWPRKPGGFLRREKQLPDAPRAERDQLRSGRYLALNPVVFRLDAPPVSSTLSAVSCERTPRSTDGITAAQRRLSATLRLPRWSAVASFTWRVASGIRD